MRLSRAMEVRAIAPLKCVEVRACAPVTCQRGECELRVRAPLSYYRNACSCTCGTIVRARAPVTCDRFLCLCVSHMRLS